MSPNIIGTRKRVDAPRPATIQDFHLLGDGDDPADAAADENRNAVGVFVFHLDAGVIERFETCDASELGETIQSSGLTPAQNRGGVEIANFAGDP